MTSPIEGAFTQGKIDPDPPRAKKVLGIFRRPKLSTLDKILLGLSQAAIMGDWTTTLDMSRRLGEGYREVGPGKIFLGSRPTPGRVNTVFALGSIGNAMIASQLPAKARKAWLAAVTLAELRYALHNRAAGLRFSARF